MELDIDTSVRHPESILDASTPKLAPRVEEVGRSHLPAPLVNVS
jgi:hypothetical protein